MFELGDLKQTRVYWEGKQEGRLEAKLEAAPRSSAFGLTVEQVAEALGLDIEQVGQLT